MARQRWVIALAAGGLTFATLIGASCLLAVDYEKGPYLPASGGAAGAGGDSHGGGGGAAGSTAGGGGAGGSGEAGAAGSGG